MDFTTPAYFLFLPFVAALVALGGARWGRGLQVVALTVASWIFFWWASGWHILLLAASTLTDYTIGRRLGVEHDPKRRLRLLQLSLALNLGLLVVFKYADLFVRTAVGLGASVGVEVPLVETHWLLPVGISFYTFQTLSYTVDRYRGTAPPSRSWWDFALYVSFFPQLVAGPIVRVQTFGEQIRGRLRARTDDLIEASTRISLGLFKKLVIADNIAPFVSAVLDADAAISPVWTWLATLGFAIQIYCDFSAYSDIAIGSARLFGIVLPENFAWPYFAKHPSEFWRRWHISLSTWLRDYLYIPLGGNRGSRWATQRNLALTMLLGGLWHGASWNFVLWGALHGGYLVVHRAWQARVTSTPGWLVWVGAIATQYAVLFAWLVFRVEDTGLLLHHLPAFALAPAYLMDAATVPAGLAEVARVAFVAMGGFVVLHTLSYRLGGARHWLVRQHVALWAGTQGVLWLATWLLAAAERPAFIYFRF
jgi:D-alanyl-lipoteichoic acid acyltransferase DltB (MBOAT superfamily)